MEGRNVDGGAATVQLTTAKGGLINVAGLVNGGTVKLRANAGITATNVTGANLSASILYVCVGAATGNTVVEHRRVLSRTGRNDFATGQITLHNTTGNVAIGGC